MGILKSVIRCNKKHYLMNIYEYDTYEITNLLEARKLKKKYPEGKLNFLHRNNSIVWQGPIYIKILSEKLKSKNCNYIVEVGDNIALTLLLISFKIKILAIDKKVLYNHKDKILSITMNKRIKVVFLDSLNIIDNYK